MPVGQNNARAFHTKYRLKEPEELRLPRSVLHRLLAAKTGHGDFAWYHRKFKHEDAVLNCSCGHYKSPEHMVYCRKAKKSFKDWPWPDDSRRTLPQSDSEHAKYLSWLLETPSAFHRFLEVTRFFTDICPRG